MGVDSHVLTTEDGYILKLFRVYPRTWSEDALKNRPVILLQHGLMSSAEAFAMNGKNSLAILLAEEGYDVWLGNNRGSVYSRGHKTKFAEGDYFDYSFYELGKYDLVSTVDYIMNLTQATSISYVSYLEGSIPMLSALSENQGEMRSKINFFIQLGPVVLMKTTQLKVF